MTANDVHIVTKKQKLAAGKLFRSTLVEKSASSATAKVSAYSQQGVAGPVIHNGLDANTAAKFKSETTCIFPEHKQPLLK